MESHGCISLNGTAATLRKDSRAAGSDFHFRHGRWHLDQIEAKPWDPVPVAMLHKWPIAVTTINASCPRFLRLDRLYANRNGNGHAFFQFNAFMALAAKHNLTAIASYHVTCSVGCNREGLNETNNYFFGDYFLRNAQSRNNHTKSYVIKMMPPKGTEAALHNSMGVIMDRIQRDALCNVEVYIHRNTMHVLKPSEDSISTPGFRSAFNSQHDRLARLRLRRANNRESDTELQPLRIAVHIRRGEVYNKSLDPRGSGVLAGLFNRLSPVRTFLDLVRKLVGAIESNCCLTRPPIPIHVAFAAEGAKVIQPGRSVKVIDIEGEVDPIVSLEDLPGVARLSVARDNVLEAFEELCFADFVIGSRSGFTALAAHLCEAPLFITMPFWVSYNQVPNVIVLSENHTSVGKFSRFHGNKQRVTPIVDEYDLPRELLLRRVKEEHWCHERCNARQLIQIS